MFLTSITFYSFAILALVSSVLVIVSINPIHSVLYLILVFFNSIAILFFLDRDFLAMLFLIVYVGAIAILFLFVVMLLNIKITVSNLSIVRYFPIGLLIVIIFYIEYTSSLSTYFIGANNFDLHYTDWMNLESKLTNIDSIGSVLYTYYVDSFLLSAMILFLSMISAIVITHYSEYNTKRQYVHKQLLRVAQLNLFK